MREAWAATLLAITAAGMISWGRAFRQLAHRLPLVTWNERNRVPWAFFDLLALIAITLCAGIVVHEVGWLPGGDDPAKLALQEQRVRTAGIIAASLLPVAIGLPLIALRSGATLVDFGWDVSRIISDFRLGLRGFVMLAPPLYGLQALLVLLWKPSTHPLVEGIRKTPDPALYFLVCVAAVIAAPVVEEIAFRVVLQGFLEKVCSWSGQVHELLLGSGRRYSLIQSSPANHIEPGTHPLPISPDGDKPSVSSLPTRSGYAEYQSELTGWAASIPIVVSSLIFGLMHWSHGPDWVPLSFFAVGLGYLYQRTHRILPGLVVHGLLNAFSMWGLWAEIHGGPKGGG